jgi:hypothetical protein
MSNLCPFFKDSCHQNECMMWRNDNCLFVAFLQNISQQDSEEVTTVISDDAEVTLQSGDRGKVPSWLNDTTVEEIVEQMTELRNKEFPDMDYYNFSRAIEYYWSSKGVQRFFLPPEMSAKVAKVELVVRDKWRKEWEQQRKEQMSKEKEELPSLVCKCVDWARVNGLTRLTVADVDSYIIEKNLEVLPETKRAIYATANLKLKSKA